MGVGLRRHHPADRYLLCGAANSVRAWALQEEMEAGNIDMASRDFCAHILLKLNKCRCARRIRTQPTCCRGSRPAVVAQRAACCRTDS